MRGQQRWRKPPRKVLIGGGIVVLCVGVLLTLTLVFRVPVLDTVVRVAFVPVQEFFTDTIQNTKQYFENMSYQQELEVQYSQLAEENANLRASLLQMEETQRENERLAGLLARAQEYPEQTAVLGKVVALNPDNWFSAYTIDVGSAQGVYKDAPVINAQGLIGRVLEVHAGYSVVMTLADGRSAVAGMVERTRDIGIVYGNLSLSEQEDICILRRLSSGADYQPGDRLITSGLDQLYPKGMLIGTVTRVSREASGERYAVVQPAATFRNVEEVVVLLSPDHVPQEEAEGS